MLLLPLLLQLKIQTAENIFLSLFNLEKQSTHRWPDTWGAPLAYCILTWYAYYLRKTSLRCQSRLKSLNLSSLHLFVQSQQRKHQKNVWNLSKVNIKDTRMKSMTSFWCLYYYPWTGFTHCSGVFIVDSEQVNASLVLYNTFPKTFLCFTQIRFLDINH